MEIISIINYKGGVGKTTVTSNLAAELAKRNKRVLLLDMDAQASLTFSFVSPDFWDQQLKTNITIKNYFDCISQSIPPIDLSKLVFSPITVNETLKQLGSSGSVDLICSHLGLINIDLELATLLGGANMQQSKQKYIKVHAQLRSSIHNFASGKYDIVLIDCPPNFNIVTKNALIASDQILIPAKPDYLSTLGIDYLFKSVQLLIKEFNEYASMDTNIVPSNPIILGVVFTMIQLYSGYPIASQQQFITQTSRLNIPIFNNFFRENKSIFALAPQDGVPVILQGYSNYIYANIVHEIQNFVDEFMIKAKI